MKPLDTRGARPHSEKTRRKSIVQSSRLINSDSLSFGCKDRDRLRRFARFQLAVQICLQMCLIGRDSLRAADHDEQATREHDNSFTIIAPLLCFSGPFD